MAQWKELPKPKAPAPNYHGEIEDLRTQVEALKKLVTGMDNQRANRERDLDYKLDVMGMRDAWQERGEDNVDATHPLTLDLYIPPETKHIQRAYLRLKLKAFRSYETGAASGGGSTSGGNHWFSQPGYTSGMNVTSTDGSHDHAGAVGADGAHGHAIADVNHDHTVPAHTHGITFGIYEGTSASGVTVTINGTDRTLALTGAATINADQDSLDITNYLTKTGWNTISLASATLGRIHATVFTEIYLP